MSSHEIVQRQERLVARDPFWLWPKSTGFAVFTALVFLGTWGVFGCFWYVSLAGVDVKGHVTTIQPPHGFIIQSQLVEVTALVNGQQIVFKHHLSLSDAQDWKIR